MRCVPVNRQVLGKGFGLVLLVANAIAVLASLWVVYTRTHLVRRLWWYLRDRHAAEKSIWKAKEDNARLVNFGVSMKGDTLLAAAAGHSPGRKGNAGGGAGKRKRGHRSFLFKMGRTLLGSYGGGPESARGWRQRSVSSFRKRAKQPRRRSGNGGGRSGGGGSGRSRSRNRGRRGSSFRRAEDGEKPFARDEAETIVQKLETTKRKLTECRMQSVLLLVEDVPQLVLIFLRLTFEDQFLVLPTRSFIESAVFLQLIISVGMVFFKMQYVNVYINNKKDEAVLEDELERTIANDTPVNILQNTFSDRTRCIAQLRPGSSFLLSALRFLDRA